MRTKDLDYGSRPATVPIVDPIKWKIRDIRESLEWMQSLERISLEEYLANRDYQMMGAQHSRLTIERLHTISTYLLNKEKEQEAASRAMAGEEEESPRLSYEQVLDELDDMLEPLADSGMVTDATLESMKSMLADRTRFASGTRKEMGATTHRTIVEFRGVLENMCADIVDFRSR